LLDEANERLFICLIFLRCANFAPNLSARRSHSRSRGSSAGRGGSHKLPNRMFLAKKMRAERGHFDVFTRSLFRQRSRSCAECLQLRRPRLFACRHFDQFRHLVPQGFEIGRLGFLIINSELDSPSKQINKALPVAQVPRIFLVREVCVHCAHATRPVCRQMDCWQQAR
jgi:hypothetical protein